MDEMIIALRTLLEGIWGEITFTTSEVARQLAFIRTSASDDETDGELYFRSIKHLGKIVITIPVPFFLIGIFTSWSPLIATMGLIWALFTVLFATAASPVAIFVSSLVQADKRKKISDDVESYMATVKKALYVELTITVAFLVIPMDNNPWAVPELAVLVLFFVLSGAKGKFGKRMLNAIASVAMVMILWSMFAPQSYSNLQTRLRVIDPFVGRVIGRSPAVPAGGLTTDPAELHSAVVQAQQEQTQTTEQARTQSQPTPSGMRGYAVQPEQSADIRFSDNENVKSVQVADGQFTSWIYLPTVPGSFSTEINPPLGPGQSIVIYCLDGRVFVRTAGHNPVIAPGPQAISLMGRGWSGTETIRDLRLHQKSGQTLK